MNSTLLFTVAMVVLALHAAIDAFIAPEPGTSWSDHVGRGVATLAILTAAGFANPRLRTGARAGLAAVFGALAGEAAVLAIVDSRATGPRGEDWTGFVFAPISVALGACAGVLLWRSRNPGRLRWLRRVGLAACSVVAVYWLVLPVGMAILATHRPRAAVAPASLRRPHEYVTVRTNDGLRLAGWYVRSRNGAAVISYPTRKGKLAQPRMLTRHGYGVLLLDARGYDGSQGDANVFGWEDANDIDAAAAWLRNQPDVRNGRVGGIGFSVGGETMLQAAASNPDLRSVVSEGAGFRSVREDVLRGPRGWFAVPAAVVQTTALAVLSGTGPPPSLKDLLPRISRPLFLIYAGHGAGGEEFNPAYYRAARAPKQLWKIAEAGHTGGYQARPHEYERRVIGFFDQTLLGEE